MKKKLSLILTVLLVVSMFMAPVQAQAAEVTSGPCGENVTWELSGDGTLTISGTGPMTDFSVWYSPLSDRCSSITTIVIEDGVTDICTNAFAMCTNVTIVYIPNSITAVGAYAFYSCYNLADIYYSGTAEEWAAIGFNLSRVSVHYSCQSPENHWEEKTVNATCTTAGYTSEVCPCGNERNVVKTDEALGHDLSQWVANEEPTRAGVFEKVRFCQREGCSYTETEVYYPNNPPASVDTVAEKVDWIAEQCRKSGLTDPWQIALWLHDWLINNANYDFTFTYYGPNGVLLKGTGVCDSYTRAYGLLLDEFGIENKRVVSEEMDHAWNLVKIDGEWFHVDCTWDDPDENPYAVCTHGYFGLTDAMMMRDHTWPTSGYPASTSNINTYPIRMGYPAFATKEEMMVCISKEAAERKEQFYIYYIGDDPYFPFMEALDEWEKTYGWKFGVNNISYRDFRLGECYLQVYSYGDPREKPDNFDATHTHYYMKEIVAPVCEEKGYSLYTCACGDTYMDSYTDALEHDLGDWEIVGGQTFRACQRKGCGYKAFDGWVQEEGGWCYYRDGEKLTAQWLNDAGKRYYFDGNGIMATGWQLIDGKWYYLNSAMQTGWQRISGSWYYLGSDGVMQTGWIKDNGTWYYLSASGVMQTGWVKSGGSWYYMSSGGAMMTGWVNDGGKWYYMSSGGAMQTGWVNDGGKWYYLNSHMVTGWLDDGGKLYYLKNEMKTGWQLIDGKWYYLNTHMQTGWLYSAGKWYYLGTDGVMVTGTHIIDGKSYTFNASGVWVG